VTVSSLIAFACALIIAAGSPGPTIAALVARVLTRGVASIVPFLAAIWIGEALWLLAAVLGLTALANAMHQAFVILKYLGAAYLLYLAYRMWGAPAAVHEGKLPEQRSAFALFGSGFAITIGNPKIMAFYLALLPALIDVPNLTQDASLCWSRFSGLCSLPSTSLGSWVRAMPVAGCARRVRCGAMGAAAVVIANR
jgi:threonine/homoserine/homoserine lactone efflux protein